MERRDSRSPTGDPGSRPAGDGGQQDNAGRLSAPISVPRYAADQIIGDRGEQQDAFAIHDEAQAEGLPQTHLLLVLADGMGGHSGGAVASSVAVEAFVESYRQAEGPVISRLREGLESANRALDDKIGESPELDDMGCTLVGAVITDAGVEWISVGDSPMWLVENDALRRLNADHSMKPVLARMVEFGELTAEEAADDGRRHMLRSAVMGDEIELKDESDAPVPLGGCRLILASDGLETLAEPDIAAMAGDGAHDSPKACVGSLLAAVSERAVPRQDNATVMIFWPEDAQDRRSTGVSWNPLRVVASVACGLWRRCRTGVRRLFTTAGRG